jgi:DNA-binding transcriptional LysR family regulator
MRVDASGPAIEDLRTFLFLAEGEGVADVAKKLGIDGSVVSRRLSPFQRHLGLLRKRGGSLVLTDRGRELVPTVQAVLKSYDALADQLLHRERDTRGVTIAVGGFGAASLVPELVARCTTEIPRTAIRVRVCRGRERVAGIADGRFDLAILSHSLEQIRPLLGDSKVAIEPLPARPFVVVSRRDTTAGFASASIASGSAVAIGDLGGIVLVGLDESAGARIQLERRADEIGVRLRFGPSGGGWLAAREYARHGLGAAIVPAEVLSDGDWRELLVRRLDHSLWPRDHLLYRSPDGSRLGPLKALLVATATEQCRRQQERLDRHIVEDDGDVRHGH